MAGRGYEAYRNAVGITLAARRGDDEGIGVLMTQSTKLELVIALSSIAAYLMRELDERDVDAKAMVRRWALNVARHEAERS